MRVHAIDNRPDGISGCNCCPSAHDAASGVRSRGRARSRSGIVVGSERTCSGVRRGASVRQAESRHYASGRRSSSASSLPFPTVPSRGRVGGRPQNRQQGWHLGKSFHAEARKLRKIAMAVEKSPRRRGRQARRGVDARPCQELSCQRQHDFEAIGMTGQTHRKPPETIKLLHDVELSDKEAYFIGKIVALWGALEFEIFCRTYLSFPEDNPEPLPKEMNNIQFTGVLELWKTRVIDPEPRKQKKEGSC